MLHPGPGASRKRVPPSPHFFGTQIEVDLTTGAHPIVDLSVPEPKTPAWIDQQKAPLLIGQLKAIAAPFYTRLHAADPAWLEAERLTNGTNHADSIFPWTPETSDDTNKAVATIGQLKAVFSLRFATLDLDGDGLTNVQEAALGTNPSDPDIDHDGFTDAEEIANGTDPHVSDALNDEPTDGQPTTPSIQSRAAVNPSVLINGDFSSPIMSSSSNWQTWSTVPGWKAVVGTKIEYQKVTPISAGNQYCELKADPAGNYGIQQTIRTTPGKTYIITLDCKARSGTGLSPADSEFKICVGNGTLPINLLLNRVVSFSNFNWTKVSATFKAIGDNSTISLVPTNLNNKTFGCFVDNVRLAPVDITPIEVVEEIERDESPGCTGYDKDEKALMVPMQGSNKVRVKINAPIELLSKMKFVVSDPRKLSLQPKSPVSTDQVLSVSGSAQALGVKIQLDYDGTIFDLFEADVLKRLEKTIEIHAITEQNDDVQTIAVSAKGGANAICVSSGANGFRDTVPSGDDVVAGTNITVGLNGVCDTTANNQNLVPTQVPSAAALQSYLNTKTWGNQANVHFTVTRTDQTDHIVNYDLNRNGRLDEKPLDEVIKIEAIAKNAAKNYNIFYVKALEDPIATTIFLLRLTWIQDQKDGTTEFVTAHEVGHLLGRSGHNGAGTDALMYEHDQSSSPRRVLRRDWRAVNY